MADQILNIAKGSWVEWYNRVESNDPANAAFIFVLLKVNEADGTLLDYDDLAALLGGSNTECDFTNYARKTLTDTELAALPAPDDTNNRRDLDIPDQVHSSAGGATNNNITKAVLCYDSDTGAGTDANIIPIATYDHVITTNGGDVTSQINAAVFGRAA